MISEFFISEKYEKKLLPIDGNEYAIFTKQEIVQQVDTPRMLVVSYLPDNRTIMLLRLCIETIKKFTETPYELWIVDNNSSIENIQWLDGVEGINLALIRTEPNEKGSFANALALEIGSRLIDQNAKYVMTLHQDIAVCKKGWLKYLISKFDEKTRAVGVRMDDGRVKDGILHVLGYMIDFQLFKQLNLSFFPKLPEFDVGDKAIVELQKAGYDIFATPNTIWDKSIEEKMPESSPFKQFQVDRSIDDAGDVFFMHLGRGVVKSKGEYVDANKTIDMWERFINKNLFPEKKQVEKLEQKLFSDVNYSVRRFFVDKFFVERMYLFDADLKILDVGGKKENKRGMFDIGKYPVQVQYANIDASTNPDYLCDAASIPVPDNSFDGVILAEVLEHIKEPKAVLRECHRVLKSGGVLLGTAPFLFHVHGDPSDYGRYTEFYYREVLQEIGFKNVQIEKQGGYYAVLANMMKMRLLGYDKQEKVKKKLLSLFLNWFQNKALMWDQEKGFSKNAIGSGHTTGYGIICKK